jgi:hypothetical protein
MSLASAVDRLVEKCVGAKFGGADFPTVWTTILKNNRLVAGRPVQAMEGGEPVLKIRLITNQRLVYGGGRFSLERARPASR